MTTPKSSLPSPPRIASQEGAFGNLLRSAIAYTPSVGQATAFRALVERSRQRRSAPARSVALAFVTVCLVVLSAIALWPRAASHGPSSAVARAPNPRSTETHALAAGNTELDDGTVVNLAEQGVARVEKTATRARVALDSGSVTLEVSRQAAGRTLEVVAKDYRFVVVGTKFTVSTSAERVALEVREGRVAVYRNDERVTELHGGETWTSAAAPAAAPFASSLAAANSRPGTDFAPSRAPAPGVGTDERDCLALARAGQARDAEQCFVSQAAGSGLRAELALFELSRLRSDVLGDGDGALRALEQYRARFPGGSLRAEVDISRVHLLSRLGRHSEVLSETARLLRSGSEREAELRMLRGNTLRSAVKDFGGAQREYAIVARGGGKFAPEAIYYQGVCFEALGNRAEAAEAYRRYLQTPGGPREAEARRRLNEVAR